MNKETVKKSEKLFLKDIGVKKEGAVWRHAEWPTELKQTTLHLNGVNTYKGADKSLARPNSRCILFDRENNSFDPSFVT